MAVFYNEAKNSKFASIYIMKFEEVKTSVTFDEMKFTQDEDYYHLFCWVTEITDCIKVKDKEWKFEPQLMQFKIARRGVTESGKAREQSRAEKLLCYALENLDPEKTYKGHFKFEDSGICDRIINGVDSSGKPLPPEVRDMLAEDLYSFSETELTKFSEADMTVQKRSWGGSSKAQTESERLSDRVAFLQKMLKDADLCENFTSVLDLVVAEEKSPDAVKFIFLLLGK